LQLAWSVPLDRRGAERGDEAIQAPSAEMDCFAALAMTEYAAAAVCCGACRRAALRADPMARNDG